MPQNVTSQQEQNELQFQLPMLLTRYSGRTPKREVKDTCCHLFPPLNSSLAIHSKTLLFKTQTIIISPKLPLSIIDIVSEISLLLLLSGLIQYQELHFFYFQYLSTYIYIYKDQMQKMMNSNSNMETRSLLDDLRNLDKGGLFDLGHPLLNRMAESFVKAAGVLSLTLSQPLLQCCFEQMGW